MQLKAVKRHLPFKHPSFWFTFCMPFILASVWLIFSVKLHVICCCSILLCTLCTTDYSELRTFIQLRFEWKLSEVFCLLDQYLTHESPHKSCQDNNAGSGCQCRDRMLSELCDLKCVSCVVKVVRFKVFDFGKDLGRI